MEWRLCGKMRICCLTLVCLLAATHPGLAQDTQWTPCSPNDATGELVGGGVVPGDSPSDVSFTSEVFPASYGAPCSGGSSCPSSQSWCEELTLFAGLDGSKQPQDFGVNANLGGHVHFNWGLPVSDHLGIGVQVGSTLIATDNAVQVYELLGEQTTRVQNYNTIGLFQRFDGGFAWGFVYDWLNEDSFDNFSLSQWRLRGSWDVSHRDQIGVTANLRGDSDRGVFNGPTAVPVTLRPINQGNLYWRHWWQSGVQTTSWIGIAEEHGENNVAVGPAPSFDESLLIGADILAPLNRYFALYGETNIIFPADTGTVDAFMGLRFFPGGNSRRARRGRYAPLLPVATPTNFSVDLLQ